MEFSKKTIVVFAATLLLSAPLRGQEDLNGNPLRLTADPSAIPTSPSEFQAEPIVSSETFASDETLGSSAAESFDIQQVSSTPEIPADIRLAVYPQQTTKQITVVSPPVSDSEDTIPPSPVQIPSTEPVSSNAVPTQSLPVPPQVHLNPAKVEQFGFEKYPQLPRPQTSVEPATHLEPQTEKTLASLLAESNSAQRRPEATRPQMGLSSPMASTSAHSPSPAYASSETRWHDSHLTASAAAELVDPPSLKQTLENRSSSSDDFQALLQKIATSTCIVLVVGVGFVLVAKRWINRGGTAARTASASKSSVKTNAPTFRMIAQLRLSAKANLHLIEIGDQRVLVASDLSGIKTVVPLNTPFADALADYSDIIAGETNQAINRQPETQSTAGTYTPAARGPVPAKKSTEEIEIEMQRKLSELLGGEAFKDVFYKANQTTRAVA